MAPTLADVRKLADAGNDVDAVNLLRQVAAQGDPEALYLLGEFTWNGGIVQQDFSRGRILFEHAAIRGHRQAGIYLTNLLASGVGGPRDWNMAVRRLAVEASTDPARALIVKLISAMSLDAEGNPTSIGSPDKLSTRPLVQLFRNLVVPAECQHIIAVAQPGYAPSMVFDGQDRWIKDPIRTSDGSSIHWLIEDPAIHAINRRIAAASASPYENGEALQSLRYSPGQEYRPHYDFSPEANPRVQTALVYLNEDYEGGETHFVQTGLRVKGASGDVLLFSNVQDDGTQDCLSEHAGLPVSHGNKYLATRWIRGERWLP